jgi:hypothetical protein
LGAQRISASGVLRGGELMSWPASTLAMIVPFGV